ncbi:MAG: TRAP transporter small permease [Desulfobacterales bacterium]|nr:TRAP transporter small permease [Desulfobacterales bacterium]
MAAIKAFLVRPSALPGGGRATRERNSMSALEKFDDLNKKIGLVLEGIGLIAMIVMVFITTLDVMGAKLFLRPVFGALDAVMVLQLVAVSFAATITLLMGRHIEVEFLTVLFPERVQAIIDIFVRLACLVLFVILFWYMVVYAHHLQVRMETTPTARVPLYPFAYGAAIAFIPVCLAYVSIVIKCFMRIIRK